VEAWKMAKAGLLYTGQDEEVRSTIQTFLYVSGLLQDKIKLFLAVFI
jgi:hypothetical protein